MATNSMIRLTEQDYNRMKNLLAELSHQSQAMQASLKILEQVVDLARIVHSGKLPTLS